MTLYFIKHEIESFLGLNQADKPKFKPTYSHAGPGKFSFNSWACGNDRECFQSVNTMERKKAIRPKVIFSASYFAERFQGDLKGFEKTFFIDQLLQFAEIYLWEGSLDRLEENPITSVSDFFERIQQIAIVDDSEDIIREKLSQVGLDAKAYALLDNRHYVRLVRHYASLTMPLSTSREEAFSLHKDCYSPFQMQRMTMSNLFRRMIEPMRGTNNIKDAVFYIEYKDQLSFFSKVWQELKLDYLRLKLNFLPPTLDVIPQEILLYNYSYNVDDLTRDIPEYLLQLDSLCLEKGSNRAMSGILSMTKNLRSLCLKKKQSISMENIPSLKKLKTLSILHCSFIENSELILTKFPELEHLIIYAGYGVFWHINFKDAPQTLKTVSIHCGERMVSNLNNAKSLRHLTWYPGSIYSLYKSAHFELYRSLDELENLESLSTDADLSKFKMERLEFLTVLDEKVLRSASLIDAMRLRSLDFCLFNLNSEIYSFINSLPEKTNLSYLIFNSEMVDSASGLCGVQSRIMENLYKPQPENLRFQPSTTLTPPSSSSSPAPTVALFDSHQYLISLKTDAPRADRESIKYDTGLQYEVRQADVTILPKNLRLAYYDRLEEDGFIPVSLAQAISYHPMMLSEELLEKVASMGEANRFLGKVKGEINFGQDYPCPISVDSKYGGLLVSENFNAKVDFFYHDDTHSYTFKLKSEELALVSIEFTYLIEGQLVQADELKEPATSQTPLLPETLRKRLTQHLQTVAELRKFMFDEECSLIKKIQLITEYCEHFTQDDSDELSQDWFEILLNLIKEKKGVCRHRAQAFVLLLRYLNVPAKLVRGRCHQTALVPYVTSTGKAYLQTVDLGGGEFLDLSPPNLSLFDSRTKRRVAAGATASSAGASGSGSSTTACEISTTSQEMTSPIEASPEYNTYVEIFKNNTERKPLDLTTLFSNTDRSTLIHLPANVSPREAHAALLKYINQQTLFESSSRQVIYIDNPTEFHTWLRPKTVENNRRIEKDGPLLELISHVASGVIIVNWDNFSPSEAISAASMLDTKPTLLGVELPRTIQVIGLIQEQSVCSAFESRCRHADWKAPPILPEAYEREEFHAEAIFVNLFHRHDWHEVLVGSYEVEEDHLVFKKGPLLIALEQDGPITIINPPDDEAFKLFYHRLTHERKMLLNAQLIDFSAHKGFQIDTASQPLVLEAENIHFVPDTTSLKKIYLSVENFHSCLEEMAYSDEGRGVRCRGLLEAYDPATHIFWITGFIPKDFWAVLVDEIKQKYGDKRFNFALAPGAKIEEVEVPSLVEMQDVVERRAGIFFSEDTEFLALALQKENNHATIIDVNPSSTLGDMAIKSEIDSASDMLLFKLTKSAVYEKLRAGETVIINGTLSQSLYNCLMAFLNPNGQFFWNGEWETLPGKLLMVMPKEAKDKLCLQGEASFNESVCNWECYRTCIEEEEETDEEDLINFARLRAFYEKAKSLFDGGQSGTKAPEFTWLRVQKALAQLKNPALHHANPIKEIFLYDYPKESEAYACLNVLAKHYFSKEKEIDSHVQKLEKLIKKYKIDSRNLKSYAFRILNTLSLKELEIILGDELVHVVRKDQGLPSLDDTALELLDRHVRRLLSECNKKQTDIHEEPKTMKQYRQLLQSDHVPLILLMGEKGSGKSFTIEQIREIKGEPVKLYSIENITDWLLHSSSGQPGYALLNLDEFNLHEEETWNIVHALLREDKKAFYKGRLYSLNDKYKVVASGNPGSYGNRHNHRLFQQAAHAIYFKKPDGRFLKKHVFPRLITGDLGDARELVYNWIVKGCELFDRLVPWQACSYREYENICQRFNLLFEKFSYSLDEDEIIATITSALTSELAYGIADPIKQAEFLDFFPKKISEASEAKIVEIAEDFALPITRKPLYDMLMQDLAIRERLLQRPDERLPYKTGILIEGVPGLGKSQLYEEILIQQGYSKTTDDPQKKYDVINAATMDDKTDEAILIAAATRGSVVILNELNLAPTLETLLNQLLTGKHPNGTEVKKGFMVLASQNSTLELGRKAQSAALRSRFHMTFMSPYTKEELTSLCEYARIDNPAAFVHAYEKTPRANMRTFFHSLVEAKELLRERSSMNKNSHMACFAV